MPDLQPVDRLDVVVVVDNATDSLSTNPSNVVPEWSWLLANGRLRTMSGESICCAHHGFSLLITAHIGPESRTMLFDAGPEGAIFSRNAAILGVDFGAIRTAYEVGLPGHVRRQADGQGWEPDPLIMDERFVAVHVKGKGQLVFSACSHAGVINVLSHARDLFPAVPLYGVMGGLHLSGVTEKIIPDTIADLTQFGLKLLAPGHCTGWNAVSAMTRQFGEELVPSAVGKRYLI